MPSRCKGFSLIEGAIVLGIIGLVIGGVWAGVSYYTFRSNIAYTKEAIMTATGIMRSVGRFQTQGQMEAALVQLEVFPPEQLLTVATHGFRGIKLPFGPGVDGNGDPVDISYLQISGAPSNIVINYYLPYAACLTLGRELKVAIKDQLTRLTDLESPTLENDCMSLGSTTTPNLLIRW